MNSGRMVHKAVQYMHQNRTRGDLLMDAPAYSWPELVQLAQDRDKWRCVVDALKGPTVSVSLGSHVEEAGDDFVCSICS